MLQVTAVPAFRDNYIWLIHAPGDRSRVVIVDPGETPPLLDALERHQLIPEAILVTHRHPDHIGGVAELRACFNIPVFGPSLEAAEVVDRPLADEEEVVLDSLGLRFQTLAIPGHTIGHIAYFGHGALFSGDTLFSAGCGKLFEGSPEQMTASLERLSALPDDTLVYCGHEYTARNLEFAAAVEPDNRAVATHRETVAERLARQEPSLPSRIGLEHQINPFFRICEPAVRSAVEQWSGKRLNDKVRVFAALRRWKDEF